MEPVKVVVDRRTWYRGKGSDASRLLTDDGRMCCVGFLCRTLGWDDERLHVGQIRELEPEEGEEFPYGWIRTANYPEETPEFFKLYEINDVVAPEDPTDAQRETMLIAQAEPLGIQFVFEN